ncbi:unnamed protein product [Brugia timori]|nr:unnamed protein product [Brugia timori]
MRKRLPKQFEVTRKEIQSKGHVSVTKKTLLVGVTLDSESTTWKKILIPTEYFGLEKFLLENETVKDKTFIFQHIKGLSMQKLKFKKNGRMLSEELTERSDMYTRMVKGEEYPSKGVSCYTFATTCASERLELDFLKNRNGEPEMIVL